MRSAGVAISGAKNCGAFCAGWFAWRSAWRTSCVAAANSATQTPTPRRLIAAIIRNISISVSSLLESSGALAPRLAAFVPLAPLRSQLKLVPNFCRCGLHEHGGCHSAKPWKVEQFRGIAPVGRRAADRLSGRRLTDRHVIADWRLPIDGTLIADWRSTD